MHKYIIVICCIFLYLPALAQSKPGSQYISIGAGVLQSKASVDISDWKTFDVIEKTPQPVWKIAVGSQITPYWRLEGFYQWRNKIQQKGSVQVPRLGDIPYSAEAKMQDLGINIFFTVNPEGEVRYFLGGGIAATNVRPKFSLLGVKQDALFKNDWFTTPMGFIGIEWPDEHGFAMDITVFYGRTLIDKSYPFGKFKDITSYGALLSFRFNTSFFINKDE